MDAEAEVPVAELADVAEPATDAPVMPTRRDRLIRRGLLLGGLVVGGGISFALFLHFANWLLPAGRSSVLIRGSAVQGSAFGASLLGVACGIAASHLYFVRRFADPRDRVMFVRLLRQSGRRVRSKALTPEVVDALRDQARIRAERYADQWSRYDSALVGVALFALTLLGAYCWLAWAGMQVVVGTHEVSWRGFSLVRHVEPIDQVRGIFPTTRYVRENDERPCLVVHFADGRFINTQEMRITVADRDRAAAAISRGSGVAVRNAPWLNLVPPPK